MSEQGQDEKSLVVRAPDGKVIVDRVIDQDLYAIADRISPEESLSLQEVDFHRAELQRDTSGLRWRTHMVKVNHQNATFNLEEFGLKEWSPADLRIQVIDHSPNRALWRIKQDKEDKLPMCSSLDAISGSVILPSGERIKCEKCAYGQWWNPATLLSLVRQNGPDSAFGGVAHYLEQALSKQNRPPLEDLAKEAADKNIPPPCKESRRVFMFIYDHAKKGNLNQPAVMVVPPTSINEWDTYRQDLSMRKYRLPKGGDLIPLTLITAISKVTLEKKVIGSQPFSIFKFEFDKVAAPQMVELCTMIRKDYSKEVMSFEIKMGEFDPTSAQDPTALLPDVPKEGPDTELGPTMELPDEDEDPLEGL